MDIECLNRCVSHEIRNMRQYINPTESRKIVNQRREQYNEDMPHNALAG